MKPYVTLGRLIIISNHRIEFEAFIRTEMHIQDMHPSGWNNARYLCSFPTMPDWVWETIQVSHINEIRGKEFHMIIELSNEYRNHKEEHEGIKLLQIACERKCRHRLIAEPKRDLYGYTEDDYVEPLKRSSKWRI